MENEMSFTKEDIQLINSLLESPFEDLEELDWFLSAPLGATQYNGFARINPQEVMRLIQNGNIISIYLKKWINNPSAEICFETNLRYYSNSTSSKIDFATERCNPNATKHLYIYTNHTL